MLAIDLNGKPREVAKGASVSDLLEQLAIDSTAVAVEINGEIVPRSTYADRCLRDGDKIEAVTLVGGG